MKNFAYVEVDPCYSNPVEIKHDEFDFASGFKAKLFNGFYIKNLTKLVNIDENLNVIPIDFHTFFNNILDNSYPKSIMKLFNYVLKVTNTPKNFYEIFLGELSTLW